MLSSHAKKIPAAISVAENGNQNDGERRNLFTVLSVSDGFMLGASRTVFSARSVFAGGRVAVAVLARRFHRTLHIPREDLLRMLRDDQTVSQDESEETD